VTLLNPHRFGPEVDPYWDQVSTLLHFNNGSPLFADEKGNSWSVYNQAQIDTGYSKFGGASLMLDGAGDYIRNASDGLGAFGTDDFTIELFARLTNGGHGHKWARIAETLNYPTAGGWGIVCTNNDNPAWVRFDLSNGTPLVQTINTVANDTWHHFAITRQGTTLRMFLNGALQDTETNSANFTATALTLGSNQIGTESFRGRIDEVRITKGVARYTRSFVVRGSEYPNS